MNQPRQHVRAALGVADVDGMQLGQQPRGQLTLTGVVGADVYEVDQVVYIGGDLRPLTDGPVGVLAQLVALERGLHRDHGGVRLSPDRVGHPRGTGQLGGRASQRGGDRLQGGSSIHRPLTPLDAGQVGLRQPGQFGARPQRQPAPRADLPQSTPDVDGALLHPRLPLGPRPGAGMLAGACSC